MCHTEETSTRQPDTLQHSEKYEQQSALLPTKSVSSSHGKEFAGRSTRETPSTRADSRSSKVSPVADRSAGRFRWSVLLRSLFLLSNGLLLLVTLFAVLLFLLCAFRARPNRQTNNSHRENQQERAAEANQEEQRVRDRRRTERS